MNSADRLRERVAEAIGRFHYRGSTRTDRSDYQLADTVLTAVGAHLSEGLSRASEAHLGAFGTMPEEDALVVALRELGLLGLVSTDWGRAPIALRSAYAAAAKANHAVSCALCTEESSCSFLSEELRALGPTPEPGV